MFSIYFMLTGPTRWLKNFLEGEDDPRTPFFGEYLSQAVPQPVVDVMDSLVKKTKKGMEVVFPLRVLQTTLVDDGVSTTNTASSPWDVVSSEQVWKWKYCKQLEELYATKLSQIWIHIGLQPEGNSVQERVCKSGFPPHFFRDIHQPYMSPSEVKEFSVALPLINGNLHNKYISLFVELYEHNFYDFDLVLRPDGRNYRPVKEIVEHFELWCGGDIKSLIQHARTWRENR